MTENEIEQPQAIRGVVRLEPLRRSPMGRLPTTPALAEYWAARRRRHHLARLRGARSCSSWASDAGLYSGKHKTTGMNVQGSSVPSTMY